MWYAQYMKFLCALLVCTLLLGGFVSPVAGVSAVVNCHMAEDMTGDCCDDDGGALNCAGLSCNNCGTPLALAQSFYPSFAVQTVMRPPKLHMGMLRDIVYLNLRPPDLLS